MGIKACCADIPSIHVKPLVRSIGLQKIIGSLPWSSMFMRNLMIMSQPFATRGIVERGYEHVTG